MPDSSLSCAAQSLAAEEPIAGTALANVDRWLLIESYARWERDVGEQPLPAALRDAFSASKHTRMQLIRKPGRHDGSCTVFVVQSGGEAWRIDAPSVDDVHPPDVAALLGGAAPPPRAQRHDRPLVLVCTHGRRDRCCAKHGVATYLALTEAASGHDVWQTSHLGGHRFAATLVFLPDAHQYGRLGPDDAVELLAGHARGELFALDHYRGRCNDPRWRQSAESWLRRTTGTMRRDALRHVGDVQLADDRWLVTFEIGEQRHEVVVQSAPLSRAIATSCAAAAPKAPDVYSCRLPEAARA